MQQHDGSDWSYRMVIEDRELPNIVLIAHQSLPVSSTTTAKLARPTFVLLAGYKRLAVMRRGIRISAIVQLVYICVRTLWHSVPLLTGGERRRWVALHSSHSSVETGTGGSRTAHSIL